ncbi:hypothetical protein PCA31118_01368 [Pandoraea captiosa]|uniref:Uncharacterized protein n=1 Tax=Pandoraea captiosa TaxID=2508302 RepID=A0A5E4ZQQ3_9BURK|nr:hypothetical protein PCA31118_01368 [Pandoraea captiosa]
MTSRSERRIRDDRGDLCPNVRRRVVAGSTRLSQIDIWRKQEIAHWCVVSDTSGHASTIAKSIAKCEEKQDGGGRPADRTSAVTSM